MRYTKALAWISSGIMENIATYPNNEKNRLEIKLKYDVPYLDIHHDTIHVVLANGNYYAAIEEGGIRVLFHLQYMSGYSIYEFGHKILGSISYESFNHMYNNDIIGFFKY
jgi:hypothetical protein